MRSALNEYPILESIWVNSPLGPVRFILEDKLLTYNRSELEQIELFIWAQVSFGNKEVIKDVETAKTIQTIINEMLGEAPIVDDGFRVLPTK